MTPVAQHPAACPGSEVVTAGIRIRVTPTFLPEQSDPEAARYVFAYRIRITNETARRWQLMWRHWKIIDGDGEIKEVQAEGVIGQQPMLASGQSFEYSSFCPLETSWGTMEGSYTFESDDGEFLKAAIGRFFLVSGATAC